MLWLFEILIVEFLSCPEIQEKHPSALNSFEKVAKLAKSKQVVVFLDYDGTLSPIVANPDRAVMSDEVSFTSSLSGMWV